MVSKSSECPCGSDRAYGECCGPLLAGEREAADAVALMRSRYTAFATGQAEYLLRTLHATHEGRTEPVDEVLRGLRRACRLLKFRGLAILDSAPPDAQGRAQVLFLARVFEAGKDISFVERSDFLHDGAGWRYAHGDTVATKAIKGDPKALTLATFPGGG
jgi:SEC-C motif-containing protein